MNLQLPHLDISLYSPVCTYSLVSGICRTNCTRSHKEFGRSGSEEGPVERSEMNVPAKGSSVHTKAQLTNKGGLDEVRLPCILTPVIIPSLTGLERSNFHPRLVSERPWSRVIIQDRRAQRGLEKLIKPNLTFLDPRKTS